MQRDGDKTSAEDIGKTKRFRPFVGESRLSAMAGTLLICRCGVPA
jgi:hypothetical protein